MFGTFMRLGSANAFLAVCLGAFGAHGLKNSISPEMLSVYETGVHYHLIHALALLLVAAAADKLGSGRIMRWSGWLLQLGILLFSGSLYLLSLTGAARLGIITPFGGVCFLAGWLLLFLAAWKRV
jgi:uncharacterized membrane protein YgdD (TMEM256/DUF423 family)